MRIPLALGLLLTVASALAAPPLELPGVREEHVMIPMRDGQRLSAYLTWPAGEGKWPVIFQQRYADISSAGTRKGSAELARAGYVVAMVNFRGAQLSEGHWVGYRALAWGEKQDGYDTCEWLAAQPWSTGKIGTFGGSQAGFAQNFLAVTQPPHLVCQYMTDTGLSLFQEGYRLGGVTRPQRYEAMMKVARDPADSEALRKEWDLHPDYDDYWRAEDCSLHFDKMAVPCFTVGSWFDFMCQGSVASFRGRKPRAPQQIVLGPWLHGGVKNNQVGTLVFPENDLWPVTTHMVRWFDHWLKGVKNGVEKEAPVRYYVMGAAGEAGAPGNVWREAQDFPPATVTELWYLREEGGLARDASAAKSASTAYESDPQHPMSIPGTSFPGARDARPFEEQKEVRTFTSAPLAEPVEWTGEVKVELQISSTAPDTDFIVRLSDVYPDGRSILLMDYPQRARYREGLDHQRPLTPGEIVPLAWHLGWTSIIFNKGHRIRVTVASTGAPLYEPNNQTGGAQTMDWMKETRVATNSVWHDAAHPSRIWHRW